MNRLKFSILTLLVFSGLYLQAQNKEDHWLKRNWDNMVVRFNVYFNAKINFDRQIDQLALKQKDDFEQLLEVYPYGNADDAKQLRGPMEEVMKKASKVIQNKPHSKWVDDAYFLIGQTHFFTDDHFAAIEAFQFVYSKYKDPSIRSKSQIWIMKSYLRQERLNDAEAILGLIRQSELEYKELKRDIHLVAGDIFAKQGKYDLACIELEKGLKFNKDKILKYRVHFLLGQLYLKQENFEMANTHFLKVIRMNAPYEYVFQANMGMTKATAQSGGKGARSTKRHLNRMLKDDKNTDYFDQIYYELALLEFIEGNEKGGLEYLVKSSANAKNNSNQRTKTYLYLADYFFTNRIYDKAQSYYDSAVTVLQPDYPDYDKIRAKHAVLSRLIDNIKTISIQDSLLTLAALPRETLDKKIEDIIQAELREKRKAQEEEAIRQEMERLSPTPQSSGMLDPAVGGTWYFYNPASIGRGYNEFVRIWGRRSYGDWWRFTNKSVASTMVNNPDDTTESNDPLTYDAQLDKEQQKLLENIDKDKLEYYRSIPLSATAKLVANKKIQSAMMATGKIYYNDLKEYRQAKNILLSLITKYPDTEYKAEAIFYLAKCESELHDTAAYDQYASQIAREFPESTYDMVLNNKEIVETGTDEEVIHLYERMYAFYENNNFDSVSAVFKQVNTYFGGNSIQAKFDYLYALNCGKTLGKEAYVKELQLIKENYPGTELANIASYTLNLLDNSNNNNSVGRDTNIFNQNIGGVHYYVITGFTDDIKKIEMELYEYNKKFFPSAPLQVKSLIFGDKHLFYIRQFNQNKEVMKYHNEMKSNVSFLINSGLSQMEMYPVNEENFKILIKEKAEENYLIFFNLKYPQ